MAAQVSLALSYTVTVWRESKALVRTMSAVGANDAAHAHGRRALEQALGSQTVRLGDAREAARYRKDTVVDALDNLADAGAHTSLIAKVSDILASLAYDDAGFLGRDNGSERELRLGVLFFGARNHLALAVHVKAVELVVDTAGILAGLGLLGRHGRVGMA